MKHRHKYKSAKLRVLTEVLCALRLEPVIGNLPKINQYLLPYSRDMHLPEERAPVALPQWVTPGAGSGSLDLNPSRS